MFIDKEIQMDKENDVMVINVSPHHGQIESKTIYDMKSVSLNSIHDYIQIHQFLDG